MSKELTHVEFLREYADCLDMGIKMIEYLKGAAIAAFISGVR